MGSAKAQFSFFKEYLHFTVNQDSSTLKINVLKDEFDFYAKNTMKYFWYRPNQVIATQGGYSGMLLHGDYQEFHLNNNLKQSGRFRKGVKTGEWKTWRENGNLKEIATFQKGIRKGKVWKYDEDGCLKSIERYRGEVLEGWAVYFMKGRPVLKRKYRMGTVVQEEDIKAAKTIRDAKPQNSEAPVKSRIWKERIKKWGNKEKDQADGSGTKQRP